MDVVGSGSRVVGGLRAALWATAMVISLALAVLSKETGITVVAVLATFDFLRDRSPLSGEKEEGEGAADQDATSSNATAAARGPPHLPPAAWWQGLGLVLRICLLFCLAVGYMLVRMHLMLPAGIFETSGQVAWDRLEWGSIGLDHSGLIRKAENPFATLTGLSKLVVAAFGRP